MTTEPRSAYETILAIAHEHAATADRYRARARAHFVVGFLAGVLAAAAAPAGML